MWPKLYKYPKRYKKLHQFPFHDYKNVCFSICLAFEKIIKVSNAIILQLFLPFVTTSFGIRQQIVLIATKMNRRWICNDVWMDILPCFDHAQLGLKLALLSPRFNSLVDKHFEGKRELTIWRSIAIRKDKGPDPKLSVQMDDQIVEFPLPNRPLPSKIRFESLLIRYIDHSVIAFLRSNHQIFDKRGTDLQLWIPSSDDMDEQPIWDVLACEIWPIFSTNIRCLGFTDGDHLDNLRHLISSTILTDLNHLISIDSFGLLPAVIGDDFDEPNATAGQVLSKWLHTPRKDGQPKRLRCEGYKKQTDFDWVNNFKEHFLRANAISSVSYQIHFTVHAPSIPMVPFELVNEWTKEKLTLVKAKKTDDWIMKRCKIIGETAAVVQQQKKIDENRDDLNNVFFLLFSGTNCIGPLSPPPAEEVGQSITKVPSSADSE